ncbi:TonB-dependent receptor [Pedobacter sp. PF22-3]|uniref:outer membrane beta-barrel protein n=1 Tax=Pedobacter sp. PF22-3 TaxID=2994467 RepID=UPI0022465CDF|nr:outer membrane beta-barrel protein [Pedobacter sp. PF22-3]MCX2495400.1 TonB-dependent receptor [Pedobacter sp. PF22-3]
MKKLTLLLFFCLPLMVSAQLHKGLVTDKNGATVDGVTISLRHADSTLAVQISKNGLFSFQQPLKGDYVLMLKAVGYKEMSKTLNLPIDSIIIVMVSDDKTLDQVTVSASKPVIVRKIDRVIFNVENSIVATGTTVWDALGKAPGVQTKFDGGITANNKGVVIYMDDKPIRLSGEDLAAYLRSLPSDNIAKIEIIANPTARYDAQGGAVINIISKKPKGDGYNVILSGGYTQSTYSSYNPSTVFNYRKNKLNVYGSYGYSRRKKDHTESEYVIFDTPENYADWRNEKSGIRLGNANSYKLGADYNLTDQEVIGILINGYNGANSRPNSTLTTIVNNHSARPDSILNTQNVSNGKANQYSFNLNYKIKLDTNGRNINVDLDYVPYQNKNSQQVDTYGTLANGNLLPDNYHIFTPSNQNIDIYSGKLDYTDKFWKKWTFESGLKYSSIRTRNSFDFYNNRATGPELKPNRSDRFEYAENVSAVYASISGDVGKWSFEVGLRGEYTRTNGQSMVLNTNNQNNYFKLFPTLFVAYKMNKDNEINLTYNSRINRPEYWRLNPFKSYTSPYTYLEGNPALQPAFIYNGELGYTYKQQYNISFYLRRVVDYFSNITVQNNISKLFYDTQRNLDLSQEIGFSASFPIKAAKWWEINNYAQGSYRQEKSGYLQARYDYHVWGIYLSSNHAFTLNKAQGLKAEISAWYSSPTIQGIYKLARLYDVSAGMSKSLLKGKGTLRLAVSDIFYGNAYRIDVDYENQRNGFYEKSDTRSTTLSFSYRLGGNPTAARKRTSASEEEKKRTQ